MANMFPLVLDYLFFIIFRCISVENCAQTEILVCSFEVVPGPGMVFSLEPLRMNKLVSQFGHNRRPKCHRKLPLELHFLAAVSLKF